MKQCLLVGIASVDTNERSAERGEAWSHAIVLPCDSRLLTSSKRGRCHRGGDEDVGECGGSENEGNDSLAEHCLLLWGMKVIEESVGCL